MVTNSSLTVRLGAKLNVLCMSEGPETLHGEALNPDMFSGCCSWPCATEESGS